VKICKTSLGNNTAEKLLFLLYTTKKSIIVIRIKKAIPIYNKVVMRKVIKAII
jgi:hypothetical protein